MAVEVTTETDRAQERRSVIEKPVAPVAETLPRTRLAPAARLAPATDAGKATGEPTPPTSPHGTVEAETMDVASARSQIQASGLSPRGVGVLNHLLKLLLTFRGGVTVVVCDEEPLLENGARFKMLDGNRLRAVFEKYARSCHRYRCRQAFQVVLGAFVTRKRSVKWEMWLLRRLVVGLELKCFRRLREVSAMLLALSAVLFLYDVWVFLCVCLLVFVWLASILFNFDWILPDALVSAFYEFPDTISTLRNRSKEGAIVIAENGNVVAAAVQIIHPRNGSCSAPLKNGFQEIGYRKRLSDGLQLADWMGRSGVTGAALVGSESGHVCLILPSATGNAPRCIEVVGS